MLPLPNLDDRMFEQIVQDARKAIPKLLPQWTDENAHDPGITMLELMAWMTELQQYYLDRITEKNERKFLKLLGVRPRPAASAVCDAVFAGASGPHVIPRGTPLMARGQRFETEHSVLLLPAKVEKVIVQTAHSAFDVSSNNQFGIAYSAFGADAKAGSRLLIAFDRPLPTDTDIALSVKLVDAYRVPIGLGIEGDVAEPPLATAKIVWSYTAEGAGEGRHEAEVVRDTTVQLTYSGQVTLRLDKPMKAALQAPADDKKRYWLQCTLVEEGYELAPKLERIGLNTVKAIERHTLCEAEVFDSDGTPHLRLQRTGFLASFGKLIVQVRDDDGGWRDWRVIADWNDAEGVADHCCRIKKDESAMTVTVTFGDGIRGAIPPEGRGRIRLTAYDPEAGPWLSLGPSNGLPEQAFEIPGPGPYRSDSLLVQIGRRHRRSGEIIWDDWMQVEDFDRSKAGDYHYRYDTESNELCFGNNEQGWIPPKADFPNVRLLSLSAGGGMRGNIKEAMLSELGAEMPSWQTLTVTNPSPAVGGSEAETIEEAKLRVQRELDRPTRAVTADDYEAIAKTTPGLRVARAKAIPLYKPGLRDYPRVKAQGQVTVVVVPYAETEKPTAGPGFLDTVRRHLERYRLLTTELHVMPASYIRITVHAVVVVEPKHKDEEERIRDMLRQTLSPIVRDGKEADSEGWAFGRSVYRGDLYGVISRMKGIAYVQELWIDAEGSGALKDGAGDVHLPPHGLVYSGEHEIEIVSLTDIQA